MLLLLLLLLKLLLLLLPGQLIAIGQLSGKRYRAKDCYRALLAIGLVCSRANSAIGQILQYS